VETVLEKRGRILKFDRDEMFSAVPYLDRLREACGDDLVFIVGGSVRDFLLERDTVDIDLVVEGDAKSIARKFANLTDSSFVVLDEEFQIYRVVPSEHKYYFDFAVAREDIKHDLSLRDFTINSIAVHVQSGDLIDPLDGLEDLSCGIIRTMQKKNFEDDPLRLLRAFRMKAQFGFDIEEQTGKWIHELAPDIIKSAPERIRDEIFRILKHDYSYVILKEMFDAGLLSVILPELLPMVGMDQNRYHKFDVFDHSFVALEEFEKLKRNSFDVLGGYGEKVGKYLEVSLAGERTRLELAKLAILLHDVGKPDVRRVDLGILYYIGHEKAGRIIWNEIANRLKLSGKEKLIGGLIIEYHLHPVYLPQVTDEKERRRKTYRFMRNTGEAVVETILMSWADVEAGKGEALTREMIDNHHLWCRKMMVDYLDGNRIAKPPKLLSGREIMKILEIPEDRMIGEILEELNELSATGEIKNSQEALDHVLKRKINIKPDNR
jgi:poly(A) polymerase